METLGSEKKDSWFTWFLRGLLILALIILFGRLAELQIIKGEYYRGLSEGNRVRRVVIGAARGKILARGGEILADNKEEEGVLAFEGRPPETSTEWARVYPYAETYAHVLGYVGEVNEGELGKVDAKCPEKGPKQPGSAVGRSGLEEFYDCRLRGFDGEELIEVDAKGEKVRLLGRRPPRAGEDLVTNIDFAIQQKVAELLKGQKGAIVVSDGKGEILALFSSPTFNPGDITRYLADPELPLFNRAIGGSYHPGSIFKLVTATAALEEGRIDNDFVYEDKGFIKVNDFSYANWYFTQYGGVEGMVNLTRALTRSTDTFFYRVGELIGPETLARWANRFGLGETTEIDLPGEVSGLVPTPEWKEKVKNEAWFLGNTYHMAIGQGDLALTPLQANVMTATVLDGLFCPPALIGKPSCRNLNLSPQTIALIKEGMVGACSKGGTGVPFFDFPIPVACKTGTAETEEKDETHAWFVALAPVAEPELVVTVLVEKGGEGSAVAAPLARQIFDYWWLKKNP